MYCAEGMETNLNIDGCVPVHATYYTFIYIVKPSLHICICGVRRFAIGFGFSSCFSPALVRTVRIHRILNREASATSLRYVNPLSQVTFTAVLISIQIVISSVWLGMEPPTARHVFDAHSAIIECGENPM